MKKVVGAVAAAFIMSGAAHANTVTMNFDEDGGVATLANNTLTQYELGDFVFGFSHTSTTRNATGANLFAMDTCFSGGALIGGNSSTTACSGNDDGDLIPAGYVPGVGTDVNGVGGNVLIRQEANSAGAPRSLDDDDFGEGFITVTLLQGPAFRIEGFSAVDASNIILRDGSDDTGTILAETGNLNNNSTGEFSVALSPLFQVNDTFTFQYIGSGAVDSIVLAPVPLPAALPLLLVGVGGLALFGRRRSSATTA
ncbi:MAG: VPLPA-CTERM sorting domain-containing protein [Pseudomonadota bacterium]